MKVPGSARHDASMGDRNEAVRACGVPVGMTEVAVGQFVRAEIAQEPEAVSFDKRLYLAGGDAEDERFADLLGASARLSGAEVPVVAIDHLAERVVEDDRRRWRRVSGRERHE